MAAHGIGGASTGAPGADWGVARASRLVHPAAADAALRRRAVALHRVFAAGAAARRGPTHGCRAAASRVVLPGARSAARLRRVRIEAAATVAFGGITSNATPAHALWSSSRTRGLCRPGAGCIALLGHVPVALERARTAATAGGGLTQASRRLSRTGRLALPSGSASAALFGNVNRATLGAWLANHAATFETHGRCRLAGSIRFPLAGCITALGVGRIEATSLVRLTRSAGAVLTQRRGTGTLHALGPKAVDTQLDSVAFGTARFAG